MAVPERHQHQRLSGGDAVTSRKRCEGIFTDHDHTTEVRLGRGIRRMVKAVIEGQAIRLHVGGSAAKQARGKVNWVCYAHCGTSFVRGTLCWLIG